MSDSPPGARQVVSIRGGGEFERVERDWAALASDAPPTCDPLWAKACASALRYDLDVAAVTGPGGLSAVVPLGRRASSRVGRLEFLGAAELGEPTDPLCGGDDAAALAEALIGTRRPLVLRRMIARSPLHAALRDAARRRALLFIASAKACPYIELDDAWIEPERQLSARRRSDLRRARRRAESLGPVSPELLRPGPGEAPALLEEAFEIEARSWKGRSGTAMARDERRARFFGDYGAARAASGNLRVDFLRVGDRRVAMQVGVETRAAVWLLKIGYDEEYARCSPGMLLLRETIGDAAARGLAGFELLGTVEHWTRVWTSLERPCVDLGLYPISPRGIGAGLADAATLGRHWLRERRGRA